MNKVIKGITIAIVVGSCTVTMGAAKGCGGSGKGPARSASYAGDGVTQFGDPNGAKTYANEGASGKLKWGVTYKAVAIDSTDRTNCEWRLYTINSEGVTTFLKKGGYLTAKINFGEQKTKRVFLKSLECGLWKPA